MQKELTRISKLILSDYRYDPNHENKPKGSGWLRTERGWTNVFHKTPKSQNPDKTEHKSDIPEIKVKKPPVPQISENKKRLTAFLEQADRRGLVDRDTDGKAVVEQKDIDRINSMVFKAKGNEDKVRMYVKNMSGAITDPKKDIRRGLAAFHGLKDEFGKEFAWEMASVFIGNGLSL
ncbi:MAG: hypothetical protein M0P12_00920 [Paludibacteraceae bacterium]|nr:hypothetical protein [Paludibacteraceae bacterium]MCK9615177.1 hypothetical protein [Candidatus Omnitrophota bacterium]